MTKADDTKAKQAMLDALANYTGPITRGLERTCKLSEFGECQNEFTPAKKWAEFCCIEHRKRWHYLNRNGTTAREAYRDAVEDAENGHVNGHVNGHDVAKPKLTLAALGLAPAQPTASKLRRKLGKPSESESEIEQRANAEEQRAT